MGEAKRRKIDDPSWGKPTVCETIIRKLPVCKNKVDEDFKNGLNLVIKKSIVIKNNIYGLPSEINKKYLDCVTDKIIFNLVFFTGYISSPFCFAYIYKKPLLPDIKAFTDFIPLAIAEWMLDKQMIDDQGYKDYYQFCNLVYWDLLHLDGYLWRCIADGDLEFYGNIISLTLSKIIAYIIPDDMLTEAEVDFLTQQANKLDGKETGGALHLKLLELSLLDPNGDVYKRAYQAALQQRKAGDITYA